MITGQYLDHIIEQLGKDTYQADGSDCTIWVSVVQARNMLEICRELRFLRYHKPTPPETKAAAPPKRSHERSHERHYVSPERIDLLIKRYESILDTGLHIVAFDSDVEKDVQECLRECAFYRREGGKKVQPRQPTPEEKFQVAARIMQFFSTQYKNPWHHLEAIAMYLDITEPLLRHLLRDTLNQFTDLGLLEWQSSNGCYRISERLHQDQGQRAE